MNWVLFYLLAALHLIAFVLIGYKSKTWKRRLLFWAVLPIPAFVYCGDYFAIQSEHERMCRADAGLKVLIQPAKADRVRFVGDDFGELDARNTLETYFPKVRLVEVMTDARGSKGMRLPYYEAFAATLDLKAASTKKNAFHQEGRKLVFSESKVETLDSGVYEISKQKTKGPHFYRTEILLSKDGRLYAKHTEFVHWWSGIQYPDAVPHWRCPEHILSPPEGEPNAPKEKWDYRFPKTQLQDLIFK